MSAPIRMLTVKDLAFLYQCSRSTIERRTKDGTLGLTVRRMGGSANARYSPGEVAKDLGITVEQLADQLADRQVAS